VNRELANKDMQLTEMQDQLEAESCFSVSSEALLSFIAVVELHCSVILSLDIPVPRVYHSVADTWHIRHC